MKKEITLSILIGFGVGLVLTFGLYCARNFFQAPIQIQSPLVETVNEEGKTSGTITQTLSIISPLDQSVTNENKTLVSGTTSPDSWVTILAEKGEKAVQADKKGSFEIEVPLISGENEIQVISASESGEQANKIITVVYTTAEI